MNLPIDAATAKWNLEQELTDAQKDEREADFRALVPAMIAFEVAYLRARISNGWIYVVNGERNLVHNHACPTLRRLTDRERAWKEQVELLISTNRHAMGGPFADRPKMPKTLTRLEVEQLPRYEVCQTCSPETDSRHKRRHRDEYSEVAAHALGRDHLGRALLDNTLTPIGTLDSIHAHHGPDGTTVTIIAGDYRAELDGDDHVRLRRRTWAAELSL